MNILEIENNNNLEEYFDSNSEEQEQEQEQEQERKEQKEKEQIKIFELNEDIKLKKDNEENYSKKVDEYIKLLKDSCEYFSNIDGGYHKKLEEFIKKRNNESELYNKINKIPEGKDCDLTNINEIVADQRWRETTKINGPAWKRYLERNPPNKIRGLTKEEEAIVRKNMRDKELWGKIMKGIEDLKEAKPLPPSKKQLIEADIQNFKKANFHLLRFVPTSSEMGKSLTNWHKGIFYPWELEDFDTEFPYQYGLDSSERPSLSVIKVDQKYIRHIEKDHSNNRYTHKDNFTTLKDGFNQHYREKRISLADEALAKALQLKKEKGFSKSKSKSFKSNQKIKNRESNIGILELLPSTSADLGKEEKDDEINEVENNENINEIEIDKNDNNDNYNYNLETGFQQELQSKDTSNHFNLSIISKIKSISNSLINWSKYDDEDNGPSIPLVSLEQEKKNNLPVNKIDFSQHHHPGEKPGEDAQKMLNGIEEDNEKLVNNPNTIQRSISKKNETRLISLTTATERRTGKKLNGNRPYIDSPRREKSQLFDWSCYPLQVSNHTKTKESESFIQQLVIWISKRIKKEKISPEIKNTSLTNNNYNNNNKIYIEENFSGIKDHEKKVEEDEEVSPSDIINENNNQYNKKSKQRPKGKHQKFSVVTKNNSNNNNETNNNKEKSNGQNQEILKSKPKLSKKQSGIIRSNSMYAVSTSTKETKKEKKRREKEMKKKVEEEIKRMEKSEKPKSTQIMIWKDYVQSLPSQIYKFFTENPYASRFQIQTEMEEEMNESAFETEKTPNNQLFIQTLVAVRRMKNEAKKKINKGFRSVIGGLYVPFPDDVIYTVQDLRREAIFGRYEKVVDILEHWSDLSPNDRCIEGDTPFYASVMKCLEGMPEDEDAYTLEFGLNAIWKKFKSLFSEKSRRLGNLMIVLNVLDYYGGDVNILKEDRDGGDSYGLIHQAAEKNLIQLAKWLHSRNVNVHRLTSQTRRTPLMLAALAGHNEMVVRLLRMGAIDTINKLDPEGNTALHFAAAKCEPEYLEYMMICGADKSIRNNNNRLPIEEARRKGKLDNLSAIASYNDRTKIQRPQIQYFHEEIKNGKKGV